LYSTIENLGLDTKQKGNLQPAAFMRLSHLRSQYFLCVAASIPPLFSCAKHSTDMRPLTPHTHQTRWLILLSRSHIPVQVYIKAFALHVKASLCSI